MKRVDAPEILDSDACSPHDVQAALDVIGRINRWFGGVATTQKMVERAAQATGMKRFSLLEVAAGRGEVPDAVRENLARRGIALDITLLDMARSHLPGANPAATDHNGQNRGVVGDALALPFADGTFDLISCSLFAHHLDTQQLKRFVSEGLRVSRQAVLINDLVRHPLHLALVYASYPIMHNRVAWLDGLTSVRRSYVPEEMRSMFADDFSPELSAHLEISRHYLFRMGVMVWKSSARPALP
ncbi:MAG: methyltransferase domain-containing protein [Candidatus Sulfotelmatobacter sp.]